MSQVMSTENAMSVAANCAVTTTVKEYLGEVEQLADKYQLPNYGLFNEKIAAQYPFYLMFDGAELALYKSDEPKLKPLIVDFAGGAVAHRHKFGGGRGQEIAKAAGLKNGFTPYVLDATAGLGRDAFVLASLGCKVTMLERMPVVAALLEDGLKRAWQHEDIAWTRERMDMHHCSSISNMNTHLTQKPDIVYLDPMYPHREKSAQIKKEMRVFQSLVGSDTDADDLLAQAKALATYRVVVKRPNYAEPLSNVKPSTSIKMKKNRFDIYVNAALPKPSA